MLANVRHGRLIATMVDSAYEPFVLNWCAGLDALGLAEYVVVALDRSVWMMLNAGCASTVGCHCQHAIHYGLTPEAPSRPRRLAAALQRRRAVSWYDDEYRQLMGAVPRRLLTLLSYGDFDLLLTDADVLWRRSPWPALAPGGQGTTSARCEVLAIEGRPSQVAVPDAAAAASTAAELPAHDSTTGPATVQQKHPLANCARCLNAGFVFLRRTPAVAELLRRWAAQLEARQGPEPEVAQLGAGDRWHDEARVTRRARPLPQRHRRLGRRAARMPAETTPLRQWARTPSDAAAASAGRQLLVWCRATPREGRCWPRRQHCGTAGACMRRSARRAAGDTACRAPQLCPLGGGEGVPRQVARSMAAVGGTQGSLRRSLAA